MPESLLVGPNGQPLSATEPEPPEQEAAPEEEVANVVETTTAFIVCWINGEAIVSADLDAVYLRDHFPTADEIHGAAAALMKDRTAETVAQLVAAILPEATAEATAALFEQKQKDAIDAMRNAQVKAALQAERR